MQPTSNSYLMIELSETLKEPNRALSWAIGDEALCVATRPTNQSSQTKVYSCGLKASRVILSLNGQIEFVISTQTRNLDCYCRNSCSAEETITCPYNHRQPPPTLLFTSIAMQIYVAMTKLHLWTPTPTAGTIVYTVNYINSTIFAGHYIYRRLV